MTSIRFDNVSLVYKVPKTTALLSSGETAIKSISNITLEKRYFIIKALDDIHFSLKSGDRLAVYGPEHSGKRSLIKLLRGVYTPTEGKVRINGSVDPLFFQNVKLNMNVTGRRNIELCALVNGWKDKEIKKRMDDVIALSGLGDFIDIPVRFLTQPMKRNLLLSIAASFIKSRIVVMTKWFPENTKSRRGRILLKKEIVEKMQSAFDQTEIAVFVTSNEKLIKNRCNKILELDQGRQVSFRDL